MKITRSYIEDLFKKIKECAEFYENSYLKNKDFVMYLGNGDKVRYSIRPSNLPHLLGIKNFEELKKATGTTQEDILDILKNLPEYAYSIYTRINNGHLSFNNVFSKHIDRKLENLKTNLTTNTDDILEQTMFVCSYESKRSWGHTENNQKFDYAVIKKLEDSQISILCLVEKQGHYYAMSNQMFENIEEAKESLKDILKNQEITLLTGISIHNTNLDTVYNKSLVISKKLDKLDRMKLYKQEYECFIDITSEYDYTVEKLISNRNEKRDNNNVSEKIVKAIISGNIIETDEFEDSTLLAIINAWNNHICTNPSSTNGNKTYTETIEELKKAKQLIESLTKEKDELKTKKDELIIRNAALEHESNDLKNTHQKILSLLKPEN